MTFDIEFDGTNYQIYKLDNAMKTQIGFNVASWEEAMRVCKVNNPFGGPVRVLVWSDG